MQLIRSIDELARVLGDARPAFVPTMGALHEGHFSLIRKAAEVAAPTASPVVVSIFVNPTQFGPGEDFERYPRDLERDFEVCRGEGAVLVFAPERSEMYPADGSTRVLVDGLSRELCGRSRPGHFDGVATVVTKLLAATGPCRVVLGRKDYQQLQVVKRLVRDLLLPVEVVEHATEREPDGLAMSSRNRYLSASERSVALALPRALGLVCSRYAAGERSHARLLSAARGALDSPDLRIDYLQLADAESLEPAPDEIGARTVGLFAAIWVGSTRLIDNAILGVDCLPPASGTR
jgi:pantoate--beta-alanine ligase